MRGLKGIEKKEVIWVEGQSNYSVFHLTNGGKVVLGYTLKLVLEHLGEGFLRIHKDHIVSVSFIDKVIMPKGVQVPVLILKNKLKLSISRRRSFKFIEDGSLDQYIIDKSILQRNKTAV